MSKTLDSSWGTRFAEIGWQQKNYMAIVQSIVGNSIGETILAVIPTGDEMGELLEVRKSHIHDGQRDVTTLVGFTTGEWQRGFRLTTNIIKPENRILGFLIITSKRLIAKGVTTDEMTFDNIRFPAVGGVNQQTANAQMQEYRENKKYKFSGDIFASSFEFNGPNPIQEYDHLLIAIVANRRSLFNTNVNRKLWDTWNDFVNATR